MSQADISQQGQVLGHPAGLFTLFFAEMWERFSYYGMRALLVLYMLKGFLGYGDTQAYTVYGAYTALVYMTPFIGGMLADKVLGKRLAVVIGGLLMAAGHLLMMIEAEWPFFFALALLITGNGFFKPNISTTVGTLYRDGDPRRDAGFNIFYTGINLGAAMSPLLCGYVGETYGWHYGFGLATIGMLIGLAVFVMPNRVTSLLIFAAAAGTTFSLLWFRPDNTWAIGINIFVGACLMIAAVIACRALSVGGLPKWAGARPKGLDSRNDWKVYLGTVIAVPVFAMLVSGFSPFRQPPVDELTGRLVPVPTNAERLEERVASLENFGVDQTVIDVVKRDGITGQLTQRGKTYQIVPEEFINEVKGISNRRVNRVLMVEMLKNAGQQVSADASYVTVAQQLKAAGLEIDSEQDFSQLENSQKQALFSAIGNEFGLEFSDEQIAKFKTPETTTNEINDMRSSFLGSMAGIFLEEVSKPAGLVLTILGSLAFGYLIRETFKLDAIPRDRMLAALALIFFQMLFFALFEQAGSSVSIFTDRNIDRVAETRSVDSSMIGESIRIEPTQAQLGFERNGEVFTLNDLDGLRNVIKEYDDVDAIDIEWTVVDSNEGMGIADRLDELPTSIFQSFNPIYILFLALAFNWMWALLRRVNMEPSAALKFSFGLMQLGLGFGAFWIGAQLSNEQGMVNVGWLALGFLLHTSGELCLSPVGLSTMTKLSPKSLVSTLMGAWFLATAFSQYLAGVISQLTSADKHGLSSGDFPAPKDTVHIYGDVFFVVCVSGIIAGLICAVLSPLLTYLMHEKEVSE